jgi:predicted phage baseplate assembly protein
VSWANTTPLHFDFCAADVIVRGNMVVATHGETVTETLSAPGGPQRPRIELANAPLAHLDPNTLALVAPPVTDSAATIPDILQRTPHSTSTLQLQVEGEPWQEQQSLLDSSADAHVYRVEVDDEGRATLVFGQGGSGAPGEQFGLRPAPGDVIEALYRVGGGANGNLAPDTLVQPHPSEFDAMTWFISVTNPLPTTGGKDLESRDHARRFGPPTFHDPLVAVTVADYQKAAQDFTEPDGSHPIQRANAAFRWTGSWLTVTLGVDPRGSEGLTPQLRADLLNYLETRRLAGYDLEVTAATYVPVDLIINFCVKDGFRSADVQQRIEQALSNSELPGGAEGFFHPDHFSFGDPIFVSRLYAAVMSVPGVESARIVRLARLHAAHPDDETKVNLKLGQFTVGSNEIVRLDNDRNFPENGALTVQSLEAGR